MKSIGRRRGALALCAIAWLATLPAQAGETVPASVQDEVWDRPRTGRSLLGVPAFGRALAALAADPQARVLIRHAPGADAPVQAEELKSWFAAHAIASERIVLRGDLPARHPVELVVSAPVKP